jgi:hypothetical protein
VGSGVIPQTPLLTRSAGFLSSKVQVQKLQIFQKVLDVQLNEV